MTQIVPYRVDIPQADLDDLHDRLARTRLPATLPDDGWRRGVPLEYLRSLLQYWGQRFDWRAQEATLNKFDQFTTTIDGQRIHFMHVRSPEPDALPLLITHGYPGSVAEFTQILGPLTDPRAHGGDPADAFSVVAPSLPGFGFSTPLSGKGWEVARTSRAWIELMRRIGYTRYGAQGGDIGAGVAGMVGGLDRDRVVGVHINSDVLGAASMAGEYMPVDLDALTAEEQAHLTELKQPLAEGKGYLQLQSTRPYTVAYGLTDSPAAQLAWIVEKCKEWTSPAVELPEQAMDLDQLLTNVSLYWFTGAAPTAANFLYEAAHSYDWGDGSVAAQQGWAVFGGRDPLMRKLFDPHGRIGHWSEFDEGGHFPAMEVPQLLVADVRDFFRPLR